MNKLRTADAARRLPVVPPKRMTIETLEESILEAAREGIQRITVGCESRNKLAELGYLLASKPYYYSCEVKATTVGTYYLTIDWSLENSKPPYYTNT
jgi:hypothetical protein